MNTGDHPMTWSNERFMAALRQAVQHAQAQLDVQGKTDAQGDDRLLMQLHALQELAKAKLGAAARGIVL